MAMTNALLRSANCDCWYAKTQLRTWPKSGRRDTPLAHREALPFAKLKAIKHMTASRNSLRLLLASLERAAFLASSMFRRSWAECQDAAEEAGGMPMNMQGTVVLTMAE